jgi:hypothetical protein
MNQTVSSEIQLAKDNSVKADTLAVQAAQEAQIASCAACKISREAYDQLEKAKAVKISFEKKVKIVQDIAAKASQDVKDAIVQLEHANVILEIKYNASSEAEYLSTQAKHFANVTQDIAIQTAKVVLCINNSVNKKIEI